MQAPSERNAYQNYIMTSRKSKAPQHNLAFSLFIQEEYSLDLVQFKSMGEENK